jgi:hypothetical protein
MSVAFVTSGTSALGFASSRYRRWRNRNSDGTFVTEYDQQAC